MGLSWGLPNSRKAYTDSTLKLSNEYMFILSSCDFEVSSTYVGNMHYLHDSYELRCSQVSSFSAAHAASTRIHVDAGGHTVCGSQLGGPEGSPPSKRS